MNNVELEKRIGEFIKYNRVILIDGPWGSGKTYALNEYIKSRDGLAEKNIYYTSLFGIESISNLSKEIFMWLHPFSINNKADGSITLSFIKGIFGFDINLDYALKGKEKIDDGNGKIIILDDLERVNFQKVCMSDILGYIERLTIYGFTVVLIVNSSELKEKERLALDKFNEKVIEVKIKVDNCDSSIIDKQFNNLGVSLDGLYEYFDSNIRLAARVKRVYLNILQQLEGKDIEYNKDTLFSLCVHTITGIYTNVGYPEYKVSLSENKNAIDFSRAFEKNEWLDEELATRLNFVLKRGGLWPSPENKGIIKGIAKFDYDGDIKLLVDYYEKQNATLNEDSFFYGDKDREKLYKDKINIVTGPGQHDKELVIGEIFKISHEGYDYLITENYDKLKKTLSTTYYMKFIRNSRDVDDWCRQSELFKKLIDESVKEYKKLYCERIAIDIENCYRNKDYKKASDICEEFCNIRYNDYPIVILAESFQKNNYYLDLIGETFTKEYWDFVSYVAVIIKYAECSEDYITFLNNLLKENPDNKALDERAESLKNRAVNQS